MRSVPPPPYALRTGEHGNGEGATTRRKIRLLSNSEKAISSYRWVKEKAEF